RAVRLRGRDRHRLRHAGRLLPGVARDQSAAAPRPGGVMSHSVSRLGGHGRRAGRQDTAEEAPLIRWLLIGVALLFVCAFLLVPLVIVFSSAFVDGLDAYLDALADDETLSAVRLTLLAAGIAVPLNLVFGVTRSEEHTSELQSRENLVCR